MNKLQSNIECPFEVARRMEKNVINACTHPSLRNPLRYSIEPERHLVLLIVILATGWYIFQNHLFVPEIASAPAYKHFSNSNQPEDSKADRQITNQIIRYSINPD